MSRIASIAWTAVVSFALGALGMWEYGWGAAAPPLPQGAAASCYLVVWEDGRCEMMPNGDSVMLQQVVSIKSWRGARGALGALGEQEGK